MDMGWTWTSKRQGMKIVDFFKQEFGGNNFEVLDCAVVDMTTAYIALRVPTGEVVAYVASIGYNSHDYYNFGYNDYGESSGPFKSRCPERILDLLTDFPEYWSQGSKESAQRWRTRCREHIARRKAQPRLSKGMIIKTRAPIEFGRGGWKLDTFKVEDGRRRIFTVPGDVSGMRYQVRRNTLLDVGFDVLQSA
jgi:hypothetical protein